MPIIEIETLDDPRLADYANLTDVRLRKSLEAERGLYMAEGAKVIERAVGAGHAPRSFLVSQKRLETISALVARFPDAPTFVASEALVEALTGFDVHRGALAAMHRPALPSVAEVLAGVRRVVILEDLADHTNVGAIFRNAAGLGFDAVLLSPHCADPLYRRSVKVSMGTVFQVPWTRLEAWPAGLRDVRDHGFSVAAMALTDDAVALDSWSQALPDKVAVLLGTEGDGLSAQSLAHSDVVIQIPMAGGVDSLNVAAASAVALWELRGDKRGAKS